MSAIQDLKSYIPPNALPYVTELILRSDIHLKIVKKRRTKYGDFRPGIKKNKSVVTINSDLNNYAFLITLVHEIAHALVHKYIRKRTLPHGNEWKNTFKEIMEPLLTTSIFPEDILQILAIHMKNPKASTIADLKLYKALRKHDPERSFSFLEDLEQGAVFMINNGRTFVKMEKKRKNFLCVDLKSKRKYMINPMAEVVRA